MVRNTRNKRTGDEDKTPKNNKKSKREESVPPSDREEDSENLSSKSLHDNGKQSETQDKIVQITEKTGEVSQITGTNESGEHGQSSGEVEISLNTENSEKKSDQSESHENGRAVVTPKIRKATKFDKSPQHKRSKKHKTKEYKGKGKGVGKGQSNFRRHSQETNDSESEENSESESDNSSEDSIDYASSDDSDWNRKRSRSRPRKFVKERRSRDYRGRSHSRKRSRSRSRRHDRGRSRSRSHRHSDSSADDRIERMIERVLAKRFKPEGKKNKRGKKLKEADRTPKGGKQNKPGVKVLHSPSDFSVYRPAVQKLNTTDQEGVGTDVNTVNNYIQRLHLENRERHSKTDESGDECESSDGQKNEESEEDEQEHTDRVTKEMVVAAEKYKAELNPPRGEQSNNLTNRTPAPSGNR